MGAGTMRTFYLGAHMPHWLASVSVPLFVSHRRLAKRRTLPRRVQGRWALDSGGFTEISTYGRWQTSPAEYVEAVERYRTEIGQPDFVAPQDWMCEPFMLDRTGLSVAAHQDLTVGNFLDLRDHLGAVVIPVLQGWAVEDYLACVELYAEAGVDLWAEALVGIGSVCRRQDTAEAALIVETLADLGLALHGFGIKIDGLRRYGDCLESADSMAWSYAGRRRGPCSRGCQNHLHWALDWRADVLRPVPVQGRLLASGGRA